MHDEKVRAFASRPEFVQPLRMVSGNLCIDSISHLARLYICFPDKFKKDDRTFWSMTLKLRQHRIHTTGKLNLISIISLQVTHARAVCSHARTRTPTGTRTHARVHLIKARQSGKHSIFQTGPTTCRPCRILDWKDTGTI